MSTYRLKLALGYEECDFNVTELPIGSDNYAAISRWVNDNLETVRIALTVLASNAVKP